jgi:SpoVK/Ycf46/Vps4 family AAA+-type ATPase
MRGRRRRAPGTAAAGGADRGSSLGALARRIEPRAKWNELVLPKSVTELLERVGDEVRKREVAYEEWSVARRRRGGAGTPVLVVGGTGTSRTLAAHELARRLDRALYRVDLSIVVSKYIGETEKNLGRVFAAAESSGAILVFDEADALFGKRTEVRDSHDRYANIEVSYLLRRLDAHCGLTIFTARSERGLDRAFLRRLKFIVRFP